MKTMANITYRQVSDYMIPNLRLPLEESTIRLGKWGMLHKDYLQKHKKMLFTTLITQGKFYQHCIEIENQAQHIFNTIVEQMKETEGITEELKEHNHWEWIQRMGNIQQIATEIVCNDLIFQ